MTDMGRHNLLNGHRGEDGAATAAIAPRLAPFTITPALHVQRLAPVPPSAAEAVAPPPDDEAVTPAAERSLRDYPWPLLVIAAPAAVAIWSGWVGLGEMCGFGPIHPLPGISDSFTINTAITLPIGVEAYGAYALAVWLGAKKIGARTRRWARVSAVGALALGCLGQVAFHLLSAAHWVQAPWPVVTAVSCLPVVSLALAAALAHMIRADVTADVPETTETAEPVASSVELDDVSNDDTGDDKDETPLSPPPPPDSDTDDDKTAPPPPPSDSPKSRQPGASGRAKAAAIMKRNPRLTDAEVAKRAGVSVRTVQRARLSDAVVPRSRPE